MHALKSSLKSKRFESLLQNSITTNQPVVKKATVGDKDLVVYYFDVPNMKVAVDTPLKHDDYFFKTECECDFYIYNGYKCGDKPCSCESMTKLVFLTTVSCFYPYHCFMFL